MDYLETADLSRESNITHFVTYDRDGVIWGTGTDAAQTCLDAVQYFLRAHEFAMVSSCLKYFEEAEFETVLASPRLVSLVDQMGGFAIASCFRLAVNSAGYLDIVA